MDWAVTVTTAPRTPDTLTATLLSLKDAGWDSAEVFADRDMQLGPFLNLRRAVAKAVESHPRLILACQDDIQLTRGLRQHLEDSPRFRSAICGEAIISLYCSGPSFDATAANRFRRRDDGGGWHSMQLTETIAYPYGALAYVFPFAVAEKFLDWKCPADRAPADWVMGSFCMAYGISILTHSPSFVRHTGEVSSLPEPGGIPECRQCKEFIEAI